MSAIGDAHDGHLVTGMGAKPNVSFSADCQLPLMAHVVSHAYSERAYGVAPGHPFGPKPRLGRDLRTVPSENAAGVDCA